MEKEIISNKKSFNARVRKLEDDGYVKCRECGNTHLYRKFVPNIGEFAITLVQGWKHAPQCL